MNAIIIEQDGVKREITYNFELLTAEEVFAAETAFVIAEKIIGDGLPRTPDEFDVATSRASLAAGYSSILKEKQLDGSYKSARRTVLNDIKGLENIRRLQRWRLDFFDSMGMVSIELIDQQAAQMRAIAGSPGFLEQVNTTINSNIKETLAKTFGGVGTKQATSRKKSAKRKTDR